MSLFLLSCLSNLALADGGVAPGSGYEVSLVDGILLVVDEAGAVAAEVAVEADAMVEDFIILNLEEERLAAPGQVLDVLASDLRLVPDDDGDGVPGYGLHGDLAAVSSVWIDLGDGAREFIILDIEED